MSAIDRRTLPRIELLSQVQMKNSRMLLAVKKYLDSILSIINLVSYQADNQFELREEAIMNYQMVKLGKSSPVLLILLGEWGCQ